MEQVNEIANATASAFQGLFTPARGLTSRTNSEHGSETSLEDNAAVGNNDNNNSQSNINTPVKEALSRAVRDYIGPQFDYLRNAISEISQSVGTLTNNFNYVINDFTILKHDVSAQMGDMKNDLKKMESELNATSEAIVSLQDLKSDVKDFKEEYKQRIANLEHGTLHQQNNNSRNLASPSVQSNSHIGTTNNNEYNNHVNNIGHSINNNNTIIGNGNRRLSILD